jgi:hypothetical protein
MFIEMCKSDILPENLGNIGWNVSYSEILKH